MKRAFQLISLALATLSCSTPDYLSDLVYPQMGSAHSRWAFFASACRPFGMVALSPDTDEGDDWMAGYRYDSPEIQGFSHIHCWADFRGVSNALSPVFDKITLHLQGNDGADSDFVISCTGNSEDKTVVRSMTLSGSDYGTPTITHKEIVKGEELILSF